MSQERLLELPGSAPLPWRLRRRPGMKHCYIHIIDGSVELRCSPRLPLSEAEAILRRRLPWILRKLEADRETGKRFDREKAFLLEGRSYPLRHLPASAQKVRVELTAEALILHAPELPEASLIRRLTEDLYRRHCRETLLPRLEAWSRRMELFPSRVGFRRARSRWGSCSSRNAISLNIYLAALPPELADYVLVHELAHIRHKNHSPAFWNEVERYLPDWKARRKRLREYEGILPPP